LRAANEACPGAAASGREAGQAILRGELRPGRPAREHCGRRTKPAAAQRPAAAKPGRRLFAANYALAGRPASIASGERSLARRSGQRPRSRAGDSSRRTTPWQARPRALRAANEACRGAAASGGEAGLAIVRGELRPGRPARECCERRTWLRNR